MSLFEGYKNDYDDFTILPEGEKSMFNDESIQRLVKFDVNKLLDGMDDSTEIKDDDAMLRVFLRTQSTQSAKMTTALNTVISESTGGKLTDDHIVDIYENFLSVLAANEMLAEATRLTPRTLYYYEGDGESTADKIDDITLFQRIIWFQMNEETSMPMVGCTNIKLDFAFDEQKDEEPLDEFLEREKSPKPILRLDTTVCAVVQHGYEESEDNKKGMEKEVQSFLTEMFTKILSPYQLGLLKTHKRDKIDIGIAIAHKEKKTYQIIVIKQLAATKSFVRYFVPLLFGLACSLGGEYEIADLLQHKERFTSSANNYLLKIDKALGKLRIQLLLQWILVFRSPFYTSFYRESTPLEPSPAPMTYDEAIGFMDNIVEGAKE